MKIIVAFDSFKGCLSSAEANQSAAEGILSACPDAEVIQIPVSDGGDGFLDAVKASVGTVVTKTVASHDAYRRPIQADYLIQDKTAIIEVARIIGLPLVADIEPDIMQATSYGVGEVLTDAVASGCSEFIIGLGGTATCDFGEGMIEGERWRVKGDGWRVIVASDVTAPLVGKNGAARLFAPQKGATPEQVELLEQKAERIVRNNNEAMHRDCSMLPGAGAAGGLGYALMQYFDAEIRSGADVLFDLCHFSERISDADLVITGEGRSDRQTLLGKLPYSILRQAKKRNVPTWLIAGQIADRQQLLQAGFDRVVCSNPTGLPLSEAMKQESARKNIMTTVQQLLHINA